MKKFILFITPIFLLFSAYTVEAAQIKTAAKQAIVVDMGTGMILMDKNADIKMPTSSMSKVATMYMVFDALQRGTVKLTDKLPVSKKAWEKGGSKMFVEQGTRVAIEDLIKGVIVQSGNDATIVLAEGLAGDEDTFAQNMTQVIQNRLGMKNSQFKNASGWPDPDHFSTARDLSILAQRIIVDFPHYYSYYGLKEFTYNGITQPNRNPLLYRDMGVDGIKTGHTEAGGYGLMASGEKDERRVVMVLNGMDSKQMRASESARVMGWALNDFENHTLFTKGQKVDRAPVSFGKEDQVTLTFGRDVMMTVPTDRKKDVKVTLTYMSPLPAPLEKGQEIGKASIDIPEIGQFTVPLLAANNVEKTGFIGRTIDKFKIWVE